ncbi:hypothetical protein CRYUN_Cryun16bG0074600 [Craigia yunnanensis]
MTTDIVLRPDLKSTAIELAKKCAGLPIAIVTVGKAMKDKKEEFEWKNALQEPRRPSKRNFEGIPGDVYSAIELSYKFLEVEEYRPTFLLCSLMGHNAAIEDLLKYGMGLGLFHGANTIEETRYKVSTLVRNLKTSSLLLDGSTSERFDIQTFLKVISPNVLSRLSILEELYLYDSFDRWEVEGHEIFEKPRANASLVELQHLSHLTSLEVNVPDEQAVPKELFSEKLERYKISIGEKWRSDVLETSRNLKLKFNRSIHLVDQLQEIEVTVCKNFTGLLVEKREEDIGEYILEFSQLSSLKLRNLPSFIGLIYSEKKLSSSQLESIQSIGARSNATLLFDQKVLFPNIKKLVLWSIPIEQLWHDQLPMLSFGVQNLISLELESCHNLKNLFTSSMVKSFVQLKTLVVEDCDKIEEVIIITEGLVEEERMRKMVFPKLDYLILRDLPNLKRFCFGNPIEFPFLRELMIVRCPVLNTFHCDSTSVGTIVGNEAGKSSISMKNLHMDVPKYLFNEKLTFPNLQKLALKWNDGMKEILHGQRLASDYFCKLKVLRILRYPQRIAIFPSYQLQLLSLPNLKRLDIEHCYFKESVFQSESVGGEEKPASACKVLSRLTELRLFDLKELMHLWKEKKGFQNLRILSVARCPKLKTNLVPSSVCFQNLMTLEVQGCPGIIKLVTHSTAKSLVKLREMRISDCEKMEQILEGSDWGHDEVKDEFSFPRLNLLELTRLSKLESFCSSGNHTFGFPSLTTVVVQDCQKMKMFSQGGLDTPMLHKVQLQSNEWGNEEYWIWEGSLNSTIQQLFKERLFFFFKFP